ncbi:N-acetylmuramoyl-L-alanine amidase family protein [Sporomusa acidovorans]|uniref:Germination-specific N-acetylmuramoyl-L-alanine amidase n=1 Tax=Sporomusa acidovorans (strain ATCC 49682 / DSM 3132 / Mol) TaxID=1123286 RepID=A0ABZ3J6C2_SPOA4|nr:N-acetylmuramoyl-L-alanine amidase [Sporomusa acidovorans]OZC15391.1 germination-specific N-acetylmuramoyl-L-alanine amidase precursor [Sporomusa acidovorans DSM 3132]SDF13538.1 N-acetylmuramoyl-L-alanine amidase [Sporomusa acidovorans]
MKILFMAKRHFLFLLLPAVLLLSSIYAFETANKLNGKIIIVDAGHGGIDPGANRPGVIEKDINLAVALQLKEKLHHYGAKVVLSRQSDVDLSPECDSEKVRGRYHRDLMARVEMAEESDADIFISIHANAVTNAKRHGAEAFFCAKSEAGKQLATSIQAELCTVTTTKRTAQAADYFVLRRSRIPAALVEVGYITNIEERKLLQTPDYQQKLAEAIARGIYTYYQQ